MLFVPYIYEDAGDARGPRTWILAQMHALARQDKMLELTYTNSDQDKINKTDQDETLPGGVFHPGLQRFLAS